MIGMGKSIRHKRVNKVETDVIRITIGMKHVFPCINIRLVPREVLKTEGAALLGRYFDALIWQFFALSF